MYIYIYVYIYIYIVIWIARSSVHRRRLDMVTGATVVFAYDNLISSQPR